MLQMLLCLVSLVKPHQVAKALGITTSGLRMRRFRGSETIDYIVNDRGRVMYKAESLEQHLNSFSIPPRVGKSNPSVTRSDAFGRFEDQEQPNKNNTKTKHEALTKDHRYMHSIGKINQKRIDDKIKKLKEKERQLQARVPRTRHNEPIRKERDYVYWTNPNIIGNYFNSIEEYEKSKKKKKFEPIY